MVKFGLAVPLRVEEAIINNPVARKFSMVIDQIDNADTFNHTMGVAAILATHACDLEGVRLINDRVIEDQISVAGFAERLFGFLPEQSRRQFRGFQIAIDAVMV